MEDRPELKSIKEALNGKCTAKLRAMKMVAKGFASLKDQAAQMVNVLGECRDSDCEVIVGLKDMGKLQFQIRVGEDAIIFNLHPDVFELEPSHPLWKHSYVKDDPDRAFCGMISIYNFLHSSLEMGRGDDIGYLLARIFINAENHFFVEGKQQLGYLFNDFGSETVSSERMADVVLAAVHHCMESDLQVPPFESFAALNVMQIQAINGTGSNHFARPLGFHFQKPKGADE